MRIKKKILLMVCVFAVLSLSACEFVDDVIEKTNEDEEWAKEHNAFTDGMDGSSISFFDDKTSVEETTRDELKIGDTASFKTGEDGKIDVTVTGWGTSRDDIYKEDLIYFEVEFKNTGSSSITVSSYLFSVYADNYAVESAFESDTMPSTSLDGGRKASGKVYAKVNEALVEKIEVQLAETVWVLKGDVSTDNSATKEDAEYTEDTEETSPTATYNYEAMTYAGSYSGYGGYSISFSAYSSAEDDEIGIAEIYYNGEFVSSQPVYICVDRGDWSDSNYDQFYVMYCDGYNEYLGFYESEGSLWLDYNGENNNYDLLEMTEHYES